jgi:hypothetical protein
VVAGLPWDVPGSFTAEEELGPPKALRYEVAGDDEATGTTQSEGGGPARKRDTASDAIVGLEDLLRITRAVLDKKTGGH